jgi:hypothetical protein
VQLSARSANCEGGGMARTGSASRSADDTAVFMMITLTGEARDKGACFSIDEVLEGCLYNNTATRHRHLAQ